MKFTTISQLISEKKENLFSDQNIAEFGMDLAKLCCTGSPWERTAFKDVLIKRSKELDNEYHNFDTQLFEDVAISTWVYLHLK